jgi:hypothetical protein
MIMFLMALLMYIGAGVYSTELWGQEAEQLLNRLASGGPWYLQVAFTAPRYLSGRSGPWYIRPAYTVGFNPYRI